MTQSHRSRIVELRPALLKKTFTLRELARILSEVQTPFDARPADRRASEIPLALRARSHRGHAPEDDDVVDPFRWGEKVYEQMRREITRAVQVLIDWERRNSGTLRPRLRDTLKSNPF